MPIQSVINNLVKLDSKIKSRVDAAEDYLLEQHEKHQAVCGCILIAIAIVAGCYL